MNDIRPQKRGGRIAMTPEEREEFLLAARTCRIGTSDADGNPHVSALWFVWDSGVLWLNSVVKSQRWTNLMRNPRASVLVDDGHDFLELRGLEIIGSVEVIGEVPRTGEANDALVAPEHAFGQKYGNGQFTYDGGHAWLRLVPDKIVSWDFRKMVR
jgi:Pyridoxamine 5'-phosphate oxidase